MLKQAFGDEAMSRTQPSEWYKRLNVGRCSVEDSESSGPPSQKAKKTSNTSENH